MAVACPCGTCVSGAMEILRWAPGRNDDGPAVSMGPIFMAAFPMGSTFCS